jgi:hypothetical protein
LNSSPVRTCIVRKRQRCLDGVGQIILSLSARGFTTGEIASYFAAVYGGRQAHMSKITDNVLIGGPNADTPSSTPPLGCPFPTAMPA